MHFGQSQRMWKIECLVFFAECVRVFDSCNLSVVLWGLLSEGLLPHGSMPHMHTVRPGSRLLTLRCRANHHKLSVNESFNVA